MSGSNPAEFFLNCPEMAMLYAERGFRFLTILPDEYLEKHGLWTWNNWRLPKSEIGWQGHFRVKWSDVKND